jgi:Flp pilus assembly protein TadG
MMAVRRSHERGQDLVEYALLLPIFLLLVMAIVDLGRATYYYSAIHNSAREGARYGVIHPDDPAGIETVVLTKSVGLNPAFMTITTVLPDEETIQVTVTFQFRVVTPLVGALIGSNEVTLGSRATMRIEG